MSAEPCLVVHYEEIALKGRNRSWFERRLVRNLVETLGAGAHARLLPGRILLFGVADAELALGRVARIPGVAFAAPALRVPGAWDAIEAAAASIVPQSAPASFAVRASRQDKALPFKSKDAEIRLGALLQKRTGAKVDLTRPAWTLFVEFLSKEAVLHGSAGRVEGPGGLPVGTGGKVLCLLSGGIDSPVAAALLMRRGCKVEWIHFHSFPFVPDRASIEKCGRIARILSDIQGSSALWSVAIGEVQQWLVAEAPAPMRVLLYRRLMLRVAEALARKRRCEALVTGDSLGQVASQTLANLAAVGEGISIPTLRPLVGIGKRQIIAIAQEIGTFALSTETQEDCCRFLEPRQVETRARAGSILKLEQDLGLLDRIPALLAAAEEIEPAETARTGTVVS